ncbi:hypothetical protein V6N13_069607 [Hibiscus sabdariffa]
MRRNTAHHANANANAMYCIVLCRNAISFSVLCACATTCPSMHLSLPNSSSFAHLTSNTDSAQCTKTPAALLPDCRPPKFQKTQHHLPLKQANGVSPSSPASAFVPLHGSGKQVPSETMIEEQKHTQIAESCAGRGAVYTRGKTCAKEHAEPAAPGANASRRAPQATGKGAGAAIRT